MSVIALVLYQFFYHPPTYTQLHVQGKTKRQQMKELDYGGIFLFAAGMVLFLIGLSWGGTSYPWVSAQVLCTLLIGIALLVALGLYGISPLYPITFTPKIPRERNTNKKNRNFRRPPQCPHPTPPLQIHRLHRNRRLRYHRSHDLLQHDNPLA
jgi:hypothetical protein